MKYKFVIEGQMPNLNDLIKWERTQFRGKNGAFLTKGGQEKKKWQKLVVTYIRKDLKNLHIASPVSIHYTFFEPNKKRDLDNCAAFTMKVTQDALVQSGVLDNDGWANIVGFTCDFYVDKAHPRIVVELEETVSNDEQLAYTE